jgi:hypothetical protein
MFEQPEAEKPDVRIETPIDLRPDLTVYGIEESSKGICEDTFENRQALRRARLNWINVYAENGVPTGLIQALSPEMQTQQRILSINEKQKILVDPTNVNSDYLTGMDLLVEEASDQIVPPWVIGATRAWSKQQNEGGPQNGKKPLALPHRCQAIKDDGVRCQLWSGGRPNDDGLCRVHLGSLKNKPTDSVERARARLTQAAPAAVDVLEDLLENAESEPVKLKAATEILDRAGVRAGFDIGGEVTLEVRPAASVIQERLQRLSQNAIDAAKLQASLQEDAVKEAQQQEGQQEEEIVDAEVVDNV